MFYNVNPKQTGISVFHCQQCAEKVLKAYLVAHEIDPPKIHDLPIYRGFPKTQLWGKLP
jgi:HEPN domain-containing protein